MGSVQEFMNFLSAASLHILIQFLPIHLLFFPVKLFCKTLFQFVHNYYSHPQCRSRFQSSYFIMVQITSNLIQGYHVIIPKAYDCKKSKKFPFSWTDPSSSSFPIGAKEVIQWTLPMFVIYLFPNCFSI